MVTKICPNCQSPFPAKKGPFSKKFCCDECKAEYNPYQGLIDPAFIKETNGRINSLGHPDCRVDFAEN